MALARVTNWIPGQILTANDLNNEFNNILNNPLTLFGLVSPAQGDTLYVNTSLTLANLAKNTTATRYLSNTGTDNNPAWAQVALATGVSGILPAANGGTGLTNLFGTANSWTALQTFAAGALLGSDDTLAWGDAVGGGTADRILSRLAAGLRYDTGAADDRFFEVFGNASRTLRLYPSSGGAARLQANTSTLNLEPSAGGVVRIWDAHFDFSNDNANAIGAVGGNAPQNIYATALVQVGRASAFTGALKLGHASSAFLTTIQAGNAGSAITWTWPIIAGSSGSLMKMDGAGVLSPTTATYPDTVTAGHLLYGSATNVVSGLAMITKGSIPVGNGTLPVALAVGSNGAFPVADSGATTGITWMLPGTATVATTETTTSTSYTDLATSGPAVTKTIGASGTALVIVTSLLTANANGGQAWISFAVSGNTTVAASDTRAAFLQVTGGNTPQARISGVSFITGLTAGSNTFTAKYKVGGAVTGTFANRDITVIPL